MCRTRREIRCATPPTASSLPKLNAGGGWLAPLTNSLEELLRFLQTGLDALHVPYSYGYSIILLTLIVKTLTYPLTKQQVGPLGVSASFGSHTHTHTHKGQTDSLVFLPGQVESALAVQSLKPRIDLIKARYGEDKEKVSKETNTLYEQAGVNPLAGEC